MRGRTRSERGTSLIETMFAVLVSLVAVSTLAGAIFQATVTNNNQGQETTRATIYAQDKMEALLALNFTNCTKSSGLQPAGCNTTGISETGWTQGLLTGGQISALEAACPASGLSVGYVDYLDCAGFAMAGSDCSTLASPTSSAPVYVRQWQVSDLPSSGPAMKKIAVAVFSLDQVNANTSRPLIVLTSILTD